MPYKLRKTGSEWCVYDEDGKNRGCSDSRAKGVAHMKALYVHSEDKEGETKEYSQPTSFAGLDAMREVQQHKYHVMDLMYDYSMLADNIAYNDAVPDKMAAMMSLTDEMMDKMEGMMGDMDEEEEHKEPTWLSKLVDKLKEAIAPKPVQVEPNDDVLFWKEGGASYAFIRYSSNFRDDNDVPAEIVSKASHQKFQAMLDAELTPLPECWLWHVKEWNLGDAVWHGFDDAGFPLALVKFNQVGAEVADQLSKSGKSVRASHGMPKWSILRDETDPTIIIQHVTKEVSLLPGYAAANGGTGVVFLETKENDEMALSKEDKQKLIDQFHIKPELIDRLEQQNQKDAAAMTAAGVENKETSTPAPAATETPPAATPAPATASLEDVVKASENTMAAVIKLADMLEKMSTRLAKLEQTDAAKIKEAAASTPFASLQELLVKSVIGAPGAAVKEGELVGAPPNVANVTVNGPTPVPFFNQWVAEQAQGGRR